MILRLFILGLALAGSLRSESPVAPLRVVSLHTVLTEIVRSVGGSRVEVTGLVRPGVDPHLFEPTPADMRLLEQADLVLAGGLGLETYLNRLGAVVVPGRLIEVGPRLPGLLQGAVPHGPDFRQIAEEPDPHWWHGLTQVQAAVEVVAGEMSRLRPARAEEFARNAAAYRARLEELREWSVALVAGLPSDRRHLVTTHDAFGYLAREHGFAVHPLIGLSTAEEADARQLARIIDLIRRHRIKAVFAESSSQNRLVEAVIRETGVRLGGTLHADGLGADEAQTYEALMRHNLTIIVQALR
ncbi:Periplasmic zinc-binding protein TroA precursor [Lacunisphaera limnophila]|uniref:Periplasmic zinc-binding protein TroA n=1 Tax=Lacunisphaera limnophila TaxID=1838286 RepID=A0A1D8ASE5_9BACT|nr:metal ABC transporter substrate-binding protein [Lacunisphaera limnophila]AOS43825.1 Periplasmic zinc-binding protein TroA precursor [Lacunisphaera limnophila]